MVPPEQAVGERPVREDADVVGVGVGQQVGCDVAAEQVVGRLDGLDRQDTGELLDLADRVVRHADVADSCSTANWSAFPPRSPATTAAIPASNCTCAKRPPPSSSGWSTTAMSTSPSHRRQTTRIPASMVVELLRTPLVLACRPDDPLSSRAAVAPSSLGTRNLVSFPVGWAFRGLADRLIRQVGIAPDHRLEVNDTATVLDLVEAGLGVALVPAALAAQRPGLRTVPLRGTKADWITSAVALAPGPTNPAARELWRMLVEPQPINSSPGGD
jgi:hypothetical protein